MIKIHTYTNGFQEEYFEAVRKNVGIGDMKAVAASSKKFLPLDFFTAKDAEGRFRELILAPYKKLKEAEQYIRKNKMAEMEAECRDNHSAHKPQLTDLYYRLYKAFRDVAKSEKDGKSLRVRLVGNTGLTVCPYCNRDYINARARNASGAQLDHFFSRSKYPVFAVSLYNLVPACGNCNRIKSGGSKAFASPFDEEINFNQEVRFSYESQDDGYIVKIETDNERMKNNLKHMKIREAYAIHERDIKMIIEKQMEYSKSQIEEFQKMFKELNDSGKIYITEDDVKRAVFGPPISEEDMKTRSLAKMYHDIYDKLGIYPVTARSDS
ncbi:hypothetical protein DXC92_14255 [Clostridiales bacterium TF09-2AC]|nr:hypothetical protein DXC92_14255 [Clostridiales bacterium TF09-2AC]